MDAIKKITNLSFLNSIVLNRSVFMLLQFVLGIFSGIFAVMRLIPFFNTILVLLMFISIITGYKWIFILVVTLLALSILIISPEQKKKSSAPILAKLILGRQNKDILSLEMFIVIMIVYFVWFLQ